MPPKAILFDLDGTLLDSVPTILKSNRQVCAVLGIPYDEAWVRSLIGIPLSVQAGMIANGRETEFTDTYRKVYRRHQEPGIHLFPRTIEMLDALRSRGCLTGLVTSKAASGTQRCIESTGMGGKFDAVITADDVENPKPHPEPLIRALKSLGVSAEESLYVGDSFFDAQSAEKAGIGMIGVSWGARTREELLPLCQGRVFDTWEAFLAWLGSQG
jgi:pyrophosphatase PpaX